MRITNGDICYTAYLFMFYGIFLYDFHSVFSFKVQVLWMPHRSRLELFFFPDCCWLFFFLYFLISFTAWEICLWAPGIRGAGIRMFFFLFSLICKWIFLVTISHLSSLSSFFTIFLYVYGNLEPYKRCFDD